MESLNQGATGAMVSDGGQELHPLSSFQERMFYLHQIRPQDSAFNLNASHRIQGELKLEVLRRCFEELSNRHESLRTVFLLVDNVPKRNVRAKCSVPFEFFDMSSEADAEQKALKKIDQSSLRPFNLMTGPLYRVELYKIGNGVHLYSFSCSHAIADATSIEIYFDELIELYEHYCSTNDPIEPKNLATYDEFISWESEHISDAQETQIEYWKEALKGIPDLIQLPANGPRPSNVMDSEFKIETFELSSALKAKLDQFRTAENFTPSNVFLSAYQVLLSRYSGATDFCVGLPISRREEEEFNGIIGPMINTVVMRANPSGSENAKALMTATMAKLIEALSNPDISPDKLAELVNPERSPSYTPIFQVLFNYIVSTRQEKYKYWQVTPVRVNAGGGHLDFQMVVIQDRKKIEMHIKYNASYFEREMVHAFWRHFNVILEGMIDQPERAVSSLPVLTSSERKQILEDWNATESPFTEGKTVNQLFEAQAKKTPDSVAVLYGSTKLTYRELDQRANKLANHLRKLGVGPDTPVGISISRSERMPVALLGVLKAGGAYVPLDPSYPKDRLNYMLEDSRAKVLLTEGEFAAELEVKGARVVSLDRDASAIDSESDSLNAQTSTSNDLAYILYTSGSTGRPKGVMIQHYSVVNFLESMLKAPGLNHNDSFLAVTSLSFDISGLEMYLPLICGAKILVASREEQVDGELLLRKVEQATVMQATPATWRMLITAGWKGNRGLKILCGGEPLPPELIGQLSSRCKELWNMYGPTETTIWSTCKKIDFSKPRVTVGKPIANTSVYILDSAKQPVPVGVTGEIWIGGIGLARGYMNRADLTQERFVSDPFENKPSAKMYRTGDLGRFFADGEIECMGRVDQQVKVRGFRIELEEIETVLIKHPEVKSCIALVSPGSATEPPYLVAFVIPKGASPSVESMKALLRDKLPDYMVPLEFVVLSDWPLTANGKVNRAELLKGLQQKKQASSARGAESVVEKLSALSGAERSAELMRFLTSEACEILGMKLEELNSATPLVKFGLDSIGAIRLGNRIKTTLGEKVKKVATPTFALRNPTLDAMAKALLVVLDKKD